MFKRFMKDESGVVFGVIAAVLFGAATGAIITAEHPKVVKVINEDILHKDDPNYTVPANPSPTKNR